MQAVVVVGGSIAGFSAAAELRRGGHEGPVTVVAAETARTYERPPLSKGVLAGDDPATVAWHAAEGGDLGLTWLLGERAVAATVADGGGGTVRLASGEDLAFDGLVIASGASPRRLPGTDGLGGVHVVRTLDDSLGLRADLDAGPSRVLVVGAGFIGAEVAATCRTRGHEVTLVEPLDQPLERVLGAEIGRAVADVHRSHGVDLRLGVGVDAVEGDERVEQVRLSDGSVVGCDVVVVGIGVTPNVGWLEGTGLPVGDGVEADATCTVAPGVVAAGDVASWDSPRYGRIRVEHWDHAAEMGRHAGETLLAWSRGEEPEAFDPVPWFWSDQYDVRLQLAGRATPPERGGRVRIVDGAVEDGRFVALYGQGDVVTGALGWSWPARTVRYRMAIEQGLAWADAVG